MSGDCMRRFLEWSKPFIFASRVILFCLFVYWAYTNPPEKKKRPNDPSNIRPFVPDLKPIKPVVPPVAPRLKERSVLDVKALVGGGNITYPLRVVYVSPRDYTVSIDLGNAKSHWRTLRDSGKETCFGTKPSEQEKDEIHDVLKSGFGRGTPMLVYTAGVVNGQPSEYVVVDEARLPARQYFPAPNNEVHSISPLLPFNGIGLGVTPMFIRGMKARRFLQMSVSDNPVMPRLLAKAVQAVQRMLAPNGLLGLVLHELKQKGAREGRTMGALSSLENEQDASGEYMYWSVPNDKQERFPWTRVRVRGAASGEYITPVDRVQAGVLVKQQQPTDTQGDARVQTIAFVNTQAEGQQGSEGQFVFGVHVTSIRTTV